VSDEVTLDRAGVWEIGTEREPLARVRLPDGTERDVYTQAELDDLVGAVPLGGSWRPRENRADRRQRRR